jgi:amino-acid N-acetyltransferase
MTAEATTERARASVVTLRHAAPADAGALYDLISGYAARGLLLWRSENSLRRHLAEFVVAVERTGSDESVVGCGALALLSPRLGEVRSLAVRSSATGRGVGRHIVNRLLQWAHMSGLRQVLALTRRPRFFGALGFVVTGRVRFPEKLEADCASCAMRSHCDEVAMVADVTMPLLGRNLVSKDDAGLRGRARHQPDVRGADRLACAACARPSVALASAGRPTLL